MSPRRDDLTLLHYNATTHTHALGTHAAQEVPLLRTKHHTQVAFAEDIVLECSDGVACVVPKALAEKCEVLEKLIKQEEVWS